MPYDAALNPRKPAGTRGDLNNARRTAIASQFTLLAERRFLPFFLTQCLGALNDNVLRYGLIFMVTSELLSIGDLRPGVIVNLSAAVFMLPFFLFSAWAGQIADKYDKAWLIRRIKLFELVLMAIAAWGLVANSSVLLFSVLFLTGLQSTLFGPVKYSILPQVLSDHELIGGNALIESATYVSIIVGTILGGATILGGFNFGLGATLIIIATAGLICSWLIPATPAAEPDLKVNFAPVKDTLAVIRLAREPRSVFLSIMGISWFWSFSLVAMSQLPEFADTVLKAENLPLVKMLLPVPFAIGIGLGSLICERLSDRRVELGLVPLGAAGLSIFALDLYLAMPAPLLGEAASIGELFSNPSVWRATFDLIMIGVSGGIFSVPLYAMMQSRSRARNRSRIIAANNVLNALFMCLAAGFAGLATHLGSSIPELFLILSLMNLAVAIYLFVLLPEFVLRFMTWLLIHTLYRIDTRGLDNLPAAGPAVLVCNHVSFVDALLIGGCVRRPVRFVMYYKIFKIPVLSWLFKTARAIPIAGYREDPEMLERAYEAIDKELAAGQLVCIFPEGAITRDGDIAPFKSGIENIIARRPVTIIPMALRGLWGSWFSRKDGAAVRKMPRRFRARIELIAGPSLAAATSDAPLLESKVRDLFEPPGDKPPVNS